MSSQEGTESRVSFWMRTISSSFSPMKVEDRVHRDRSFAKAIKRMRVKLIEGRRRKYSVSVAWLHV